MALRNPKQSTFENLFSMVYWVLMLNVCIALACSPLLVLLAAVSVPLDVWPLLVVVSGVCGPAIAATFSCFRRYQDEGEMAPFKDFFTGYKRTALRAFAVWESLAVVIALCVVDIVFMGQFSFAWLIVPLLVVITAVAVLMMPVVLALAVVAPELGVRRLIVAAFFCALRTWWLAAVNVGLGALAGYAVLIQPVLGLVFAPSVIAFVVWINSAHVTRFVSGGAKETEAPASGHQGGGFLRASVSLHR